VRAGPFRADSFGLIGGEVIRASYAGNLVADAKRPAGNG